MKSIAILILVGAAALASAQKYVTERFDVDAVIRSDRTVEMTERISVRFTEKQHGLIRTIPFRARGEKNAREVEYDALSATIDGVSTGLKVSNQGDIWKLQMGDGNRWLEGRHTFAVKYVILLALTDFTADKLKPGDELGPRTEFFWNLLPAKWATDIPDAKFHITFPQPSAPKYAARILFGPLGERMGVNINSEGKIVGRTDMLDAKFSSPTSLDFVIKKPNRPGWTVTLVLSLPEGTVSLGNTKTTPISPPSTPTEEPFDKFMARIPSRPWGMALPAIPALLLMLLKRKPPARPLVVRFEPPKDVSASDAGVVIDGRFDPRDFLAALISIAEKGHWKLSREDDQTIVNIDPDSKGRPLDDFEQLVFDQMQPFAPRVDAATLSAEFGPQFQLLDSAIHARHRERHWATSGGATKGCSGCLIIGVSIPLAFAVFPFVGAWSFLGIPIAIAAGWIGLSKWSTMEKPGEDVKWELLGLREFIARAQSKELNYMSEKQPSQALFEELLPYAIAFGLVTEWAKAFEGIQFQQPDWYSGDSTTGFYDYYWMSMMMNDFSNEWSSATTDAITSDTGGGWSDGDSGSGSSGFSGSDWNSGGGSDGGGSFDSGGSSGDGGGGGGGDSW